MMLLIRDLISHRSLKLQTVGHVCTDCQRRVFLQYIATKLG